MAFSFFRFRAFLGLAGLVGLLWAASASSTIDPAAKHAYSANAGWLNFQHDTPALGDGVEFGEYYLSGYAYGANIGWINLGDGTPANGIAYGNTVGEDSGVNHDGAGNLSGLAYGANVGWINFGWATPSDPNRPRVDLQLGHFSGLAYAANLGWINLGTGNLRTAIMAVPPDTDSDGLPDAWERQQFGGLASSNGALDSDGDGLSDADEYRFGTSPQATTIPNLTVGPSQLAPGGGQAFSTLTFDSVLNRVYRVQYSTNVLDWFDDLVDVAPQGATTQVTVFYPAADPRRFYRFLPLLPLQP